MWEILSIPSLELTRLLLINMVFLIRVSAVRLAHFDDCLEDSIGRGSCPRHTMVLDGGKTERAQWLRTLAAIPED